MYSQECNIIKLGRIAIFVKILLIVCFAHIPIRIFSGAPQLHYGTVICFQVRKFNNFWNITLSYLHQTKNDQGQNLTIFSCNVSCFLILGFSALPFLISARGCLFGAVKIMQSSR